MRLYVAIFIAAAAFASSARSASLNAFEGVFIEDKAQWADKLAIVIAQTKIDPEIYYCHIDIKLYHDPESLNCQLARVRINIVSKQSNLPYLPEDDHEIVPFVCEKIFNRGIK